MVYFMENPSYKWMMSEGTPISGNPHVKLWLQDYYPPERGGACVVTKEGRDSMEEWWRTALIKPLKIPIVWWSGVAVVQEAIDYVKSLVFWRSWKGRTTRAIQGLPGRVKIEFVQVCC